MNESNAARNTAPVRRDRRHGLLARGWAWWTGALAWSALAASAPPMPNPGVLTPGGLGITPAISSIGRTQDLVNVQWFGVQGPYQLERKPTIETTNWQVVVSNTWSLSAAVPIQGDTGLFRVLGAHPNYAGGSQCVDCHSDVSQAWSETAHAHALQTLQDIGQGSNPNCLICHTVGFGTPSGFKDAQTTPQMANVQCENCHGAALNHLAIPDQKPPVTIAAEVCGSCHNGFHHPTYDNWKTSAHSRVDPEVAASILAQGEPRMLACGPCHSGAVRTALLRQMKDPSVLLPTNEDAATFPITCAVCHSPHAETGNPAQLRNPVRSTANYSYSTSTNTTFAAQYQADIQICGQCHNMRGARWEDTSRPPHHSPQYNLLVGQGGYDLGNTSMATHGAQLEQQCAHCHTHPQEADPPTPSDPNYTGHGFEVHYTGCTTSSDSATACHVSAEDAQAQVSATRTGLDFRVNEVKELLDRWGTTKAPEALRTKYGKLAWEYTNVGQLSNPEGASGVRGPTTAEQAAVPAAIKQARFNLYLVEHDASGGTHNAPYARRLVSVAKSNVIAELNKP